MGPVWAEAPRHPGHGSSNMKGQGLFVKANAWVAEFRWGGSGMVEAVGECQQRSHQGSEHVGPATVEEGGVGRPAPTLFEASAPALPSSP